MESISTGLRYRDSSLKNSIDDKMSNEIELLEEQLFKIGLVDQSNVMMVDSKYNIVYFRGETEIIRIVPFKNKWDLKFIGHKWDIEALFQLHFILNYDLKQFCWIIEDIEEKHIPLLSKTLLKAYRPVSSINDSMRYFFIVIKLILEKNMHLVQSDNKIKKELEKLFWDGNLEGIRHLYERFNSIPNITFPQFLESWNKQLMLGLNIPIEKLHVTIFSEKELLIETLEKTQNLFCTGINKHKNRLNELWDDQELIKNKEQFHIEFEKIREGLVKLNNFKEQFTQTIAYYKEDH